MQRRDQCAVRRNTKAARSRRRARREMFENENEDDDDETTPKPGDQRDLTTRRRALEPEMVLQALVYLVHSPDSFPSLPEPAVCLDLAECAAQGVRTAPGNVEEAVQEAVDALEERVDYSDGIEELTRILWGDGCLNP